MPDEAPPSSSKLSSNGLMLALALVSVPVDREVPDEAPPSSSKVSSNGLMLALTLVSVPHFAISADPDSASESCPSSVDAIATASESCPSSHGVGEAPAARALEAALDSNASAQWGNKPTGTGPRGINSMAMLAKSSSRRMSSVKRRLHVTNASRWRLRTRTSGPVADSSVPLAHAASRKSGERVS